MKVSPKAGIWIERAGVAAALMGAAYHAVAFLYVAISRIAYPFALEWLEGGSYLQVHRVLTGQPLYAQPSIEYVAMIYPPLYYYAAAVASRILGFGFLPMRLVSLAASVGCMLLIYLICRGEGAGWTTGLIASGLFAATYPLSATWFDIARVDMLSVFLVLVAIWLVRLRAGGAYVAAGFVFALACLTKQTQLITLTCVSIYLVAFERRKAVPFILTALASLVAAYFVLDHVYAGWFRFFVLRLAVGSGEYLTFAPETILQTALDFWSSSILLALPAVVLLVLAAIVIRIRQRADPGRLSFFLACALGMVGASWSVVQVGGFKNDLVPAYAILAILFGISIHIVGYEQAVNPGLRGGLLAVCAIQFALLCYPIQPQIPTAADLQAGQALVQEIRAQTGDVYVPFHPDLALMAGKRTFASWSPMYQLEGNYGGGDVRQTGRVKTEFTHAMSQHAFSMIILDQSPNWIWGNPEAYYSVTSQPVFNDPNVFWPVTGWQTRPQLIMVPAAK